MGALAHDVNIIGTRLVKVNACTCALVAAEARLTDRCFQNGEMATRRVPSIETTKRKQKSGNEKRIEKQKRCLEKSRDKGQ